MLSIRQVANPVARGLRNPHLQGLLGSGGLRRLLLRRAARRLKTTEETLVFECQDATLVGSLNRCQSAPRGLVVVLHGWEGSAQSNYMVSAADILNRAGYHALRLNLRDHGPTHHLNRGLFNSTLTGEVSQAIEQIRHAFGELPCHLVGFSLGGNFALRIAADRGSALRLDTVIGVCPPINPANAMAALNARRRTYGAYFYRKWRQSLAIKLRQFPELAYGHALRQARNLDDLNAFFVPDHTPFSSPADYFAAYAITGNRLAGLRVPAWLIAARDDPVTPISDVDAINPSVPLAVEITRFGGHCGFLRNFRLQSWLDERLLALLDSRIPLSGGTTRSANPIRRCPSPCVSARR